MAFLHGLLIYWLVGWLVGWLVSSTTTSYKVLNQGPLISRSHANLHSNFMVA